MIPARKKPKYRCMIRIYAPVVFFIFVVLNSTWSALGYHPKQQSNIGQIQGNVPDIFSFDMHDLIHFVGNLHGKHRPGQAKKYGQNF